MQTNKMTQKWSGGGARRRGKGVGGRKTVILPCAFGLFLIGPIGHDLHGGKIRHGSSDCCALFRNQIRLQTDEWQRAKR